MLPNVLWVPLLSTFSTASICLAKTFLTCPLTKLGIASSFSATDPSTRRLLTLNNGRPFPLALLISIFSRAKKPTLCGVKVRYFGTNAQTLELHKSNHITSGSIGARTANELGADGEEIRRHGRWCGDRLSSAYLSPISRVTVRVLAGFSKERGTYFLERANLEVPATVLKQIFPQVDEWEQKVQVATRSPGIATASFLQVMRFLKTVILQDSLLLSQKFPSSALWQHPVFLSAEYQQFRAQSQRALEEIQNPFSVQLQAVLPQVHEGLLSLHRTGVTPFQQLSQSSEPAIRDMEARLETLEQDSRRLASICQFLPQCSAGLSLNQLSDQIAGQTLSF